MEYVIVGCHLSSRARGSAASPKCEPFGVVMQV